MAVSRPRSSRGVAHPSSCALSQGTRATPVKLSYPEPAKPQNLDLTDRRSPRMCRCLTELCSGPLGGTLNLGPMSDRNVVGLHGYSKCFFPDFSASCTPRGTDMKGARSPREIARRVNIQRLFAREERCYRIRLRGAHFHYHVTACAHQPRRFRRERPIGAQPIRAAIKRKKRIMVAHLRRELRQLVARNIGRIRDHQIEPTDERAGEIAGDERRAFGKAQPLGVVARDRKRIRAQIGADREGIG